jgi:sulfopyruvate decarboxylase TPP-binding subunit
VIDVRAVAAGLHDGLKAAHVEHCIYVPDSVLGLLTDRCEKDPAIRTTVCAREDEGMAIAAGLFLAGKRSVVMMEASGIGYGGLILARAQMQRTPVFIMASHGGLLGEAFDFHGATIAAGRGVLQGLNIPFYVLRPGDDGSAVVRRALQTVHGQRTSFAVLVPPYLLVAEDKTA